MWLWLICIVFAAVVLIIALSTVRIGLSIAHQDGDDRGWITLRALFGIVRLRYELPKLSAIDLSGMLLRTDKEPSTPSPTEPSQFLYRILTQFSSISRHVTCSKFRWYTAIGFGDAPETAVVAGMIWVLKSSLASYAFKKIRFETKPALRVHPQYNRQHFSSELLCDLSIRFWFIFVAALREMLHRLKSYWASYDLFTSLRANRRRRLHVGASYSRFDENSDGKH